MRRKASDVMERNILSLSPEASLLDAHRLFVESGIHGAPVVDDEGLVVGVVTSTDLLRAVFEDHESASFASAPVFREALEFGPPAWSPEDFQDRLAQRSVADVMTQGARTVEEEVPARAVAEILHRERIHRVWVVKEGRPTGVISTLDLMSLVRDE
jgi:CBS domain-containing protein